MVTARRTSGRSTATHDAGPLHGEIGAVTFESQPIGRRLKVRIKELGANARDEVAQFRQLQRACRESPELAAAFAAAGFGDFSTVDPRQPNPVVGAITNAFNRFVEARWR